MATALVFSTLCALCLLTPGAGAKSPHAASATTGDEVSLLQGQMEMKRSEANEAKRTATLETEEKETYSAGFSCSTSATCGKGGAPGTFQISFPAAGEASEERAPELAEGALAEDAVPSKVEPSKLEAEAKPSTSLLGGVLEVLACVLVADALRRYGSRRQSADIASGSRAATSPAVLDAALAGDEVAFEAALGAAGDVQFQGVDKWGCAALHYAAKGGSAPIVTRLLGYDVQLEAIDAWDETPLHIAARAGHLDVCNALLAAGACIDATNAEEYTPLVVAGQADQAAVCRFLIERGASVAGLDKQEIPSLVAELQGQHHYD